MTPEEKSHELDIIGEKVINLYSKCWERANDCYKRHYKTTAKDDKEKVIAMTETMFIHVISLVNPIPDSTMFDRE